MKLNKFAQLNCYEHQNVLPWPLKKLVSPLHDVLEISLDCNSLKESLISHSTQTCTPVVFTGINDTNTRLSYCP